MYTHWVLILLIIHLDISWFLLSRTLQSFHFWGIKHNIRSVTEGFTECNTAFEEFVKGFREGKGKLHFRRKLCVIIQQDIFTSDIVEVTLEVRVLKLAMNKQSFACNIDFTLRGMQQDRSKCSLT